MLRQLYGSVGHVQFVLPHIYPSVQYEVYSQEPQLTVEPLSGLSQSIKQLWHWYYFQSICLKQ